MNAVNNLLDKYRESCGIASDSAAADSLHIKRQAIHQWRKGQSWPNDDHVATMCKKSGENLAHWLPLIEADRARNPEARKVWLRLAHAAAAAVTLAAIVKHGADLHAIAAFAFVPCIHYAKL